MNSPAITAEQFNAMQQDRQRRQRRKRRLLRCVALFALLAVFAVVGLYFYDSYRGAQVLRDAIAETDRLDPQWRWEYLAKFEAELPDNKNAAIPIKTAANLVSSAKKWAGIRLIEDIGKQSPRFRAGQDVVEKLRTSVTPHSTVVTMARQAIPLPEGRYALPAKPSDPFKIPATEVLNLGRFLSHAAELDIQDGNYEEAWNTALAILAADRSFGQTPTLMVAIVRNGLRSLTSVAFERCLAQGHVSDALLAEAQKQLSVAAVQSLLYDVKRGERAYLHHVLTELEEGKSSDHDLGEFRWLFRVSYLWGGSLEHDHAWMLRQANDFVEAVKEPAPNREKINALDLKTQKEGSAFANRQFYEGKFAKFAEPVTESLARLHCTIAALAVDRFRLKKSRWPDSLDEVVESKLLDKVPEDPYDGKPLRYRKTTNGVVVYSIGDKGTGQGDALDANMSSTPPTRHYEFRLWDEKERGQVGK